MKSTAMSSVSRRLAPTTTLIKMSSYFYKSAKLSWNELSKNKLTHKIKPPVKKSMILH